MSSEMKEDIKELFRLLASIKDENDMDLLFEDLCTYKEIDSMAQRVKAAKLLIEGKTYEEIIRLTDISSATLSRVSKCVKYGKGYKKFITKEKK
jgi:TrpR-related protein YerC/YecD